QMPSKLIKEKHLFIFEGGSAEPKYHASLEKEFLGERFAIKCIYDAEIYQLYKQMKNDDFETDIVSILKSRTKENAETLKEYNRDSFAYIYLFFDYDAHSTMADDKKIDEMLDYFDNETEHGLLLLSYPMVEAIRHFHDTESFKSLSVKCKRGTKIENTNCPYKNDCVDIDDCLKETHYKTLVSQNNDPKLNNINGYNSQIWNELIKAHICKANYILSDHYCYPESRIPQKDIFEQQKAKYIDKKCPEVAVLSSFPMYILEYFGAFKLKEKLNL
ncbi:MAG: hypothetical protein MJZ28_08495, partial [Paludibacteraceae bacterium]|nr:hypothetical protein [Paludibacteraceae bacterium]